MPTFWTILPIVNYTLVFATILHILLTRRDPRGMLAWILALMLLPLLGLILFMLVGQRPLQRKMLRRRRRLELIEASLAQQTEVLGLVHDGREESNIDEDERRLMQLATRVSGSLVTSGNDVEVYNDAERAFLNLGLAIESARHHVHLEYYIFADDETGTGMSDLLVRKAKEGVEVRLLIDAVGSWKLSRSFVRSLRERGVQVAYFLPWGLRSRTMQLNCRNHRKLSIVDGVAGFCGSKNIADEYLGRRKRLAPWRDTHLRVAGPCVAQLQEVFAEDWHFATGEDLTSEDYFPEPTVAGERLVQIVPSGPDGNADVMHQLLNAAVSDADKSISFITPYFVPDPAMLMALKSAAYRGVRVRLLLPSRSDNWLVLWAGRSFYEELLETGVEIHEYDRGMLHSKVVVVDQRWAMVGSANMDVRSFRINFELTSILYDGGLSRELQAEFDSLCRDARAVLREGVSKWTVSRNLAAGLARLASPLL